MRCQPQGPCRVCFIVVQGFGALGLQTPKLAYPQITLWGSRLSGVMYRAIFKPHALGLEPQEMGLTPLKVMYMQSSGSQTVQAAKREQTLEVVRGFGAQDRQACVHATYALGLRFPVLMHVQLTLQV